MPTVSVTPSVVVSETPSVSPSPTALSEDELLALIPEDARAENFGGAVNFAKFFLIESHRMFVDRDSEAFQFSSGPECGFCASVLASYDEHFATNSTVVGGDIEVNPESASGGLQTDGAWLIQFPMVVLEAQYFNADGSLRSNVETAEYNTGVSLAYQDGHWLVLGLNFEQSA